MRASRRITIVVIIVLTSLLSVSYGNGCGSAEQLVQTRIVGGHEVEPCKYGFIASLRKAGSNLHHCAGVLIDKEWVITSASCLRPLFRQKFRVYVGGHERDEPKGDHEAVDWIFPLGWRGDPRSGFDIALVKINPPSSETPVKLPEIFNRPDFGIPAIALGWGRLSQSSGFADALNAAKGLNVQSPEECFRTYGGSVLSLLCAGGQGSGTCAGDEGGPLVTQDNILIGIAVFTGDASIDECGGLGLPSLFTDVSRHVPWIKRVLGH